MAYQTTIRDTQTDGKAAVGILCGVCDQRSANKAIWHAIRDYPDVLSQRDTLWRKAQELRKELEALRGAVARAEDARAEALELARRKG